MQAVPVKGFFAVTHVNGDLIKIVRSSSRVPYWLQPGTFFGWSELSEEEARMRSLEKVHRYQQRCKEYDHRCGWEYGRGYDDVMVAAKLESKGKPRA